jgi:hypothetical protein
VVIGRVSAFAQLPCVLKSRFDQLDHVRSPTRFQASRLIDCNTPPGCCGVTSLPFDKLRIAMTTPGGASCKCRQTEKEIMMAPMIDVGRVTADFTALMRQAPVTEHDWMRQAIRDIDEILGSGYAKGITT